MTPPLRDYWDTLGPGGFRDLARDLASVRDHISEVSGVREAMPGAPVRLSRLVYR